MDCACRNEWQSQTKACAKPALPATVPKQVIDHELSSQNLNSETLLAQIHKTLSCTIPSSIHRSNHGKRIVRDVGRTVCVLIIFLQPLAVDLLNPSQKSEEQRHKLKRLVQSPNSYFMDVKCPGMSCPITFWFAGY